MLQLLKYLHWLKLTQIPKMSHAYSNSCTCASSEMDSLSSIKNGFVPSGDKTHIFDNFPWKPYQVLKGVVSWAPNG